MKRKQKLCVFFAAVCILSLTVGAMAIEVDCDDKYCFSAEDFAQEGLSGVCITGLPDANAGTVMLGCRVIRCGDILTAEQLNALTFYPLRTEQDTTASVTYLPVYEDRVERSVTMTISIHGKRDKPPVAEDSSLETYKNLPNTGTLNVRDPEGEALVYTVTRAPKRGDVVIHDDGTFTYTPKKNKVGTDSFTYTATDPAGNVSRQATVTIEILKPCDKSTYSDTVGTDCRFAAEWLRNVGLFTGETVGGQLCFRPEQSVTRGEFVAMLVELLDVPVDADAAYTGFTDECPAWLRPYLAAALRAGLTAGWHGTVFDADAAITAEEAALLVQNALVLPIDTLGGAENADLVAVLAENGIALGSGTMTRAQVANALYQIGKCTAKTQKMQ